MTIYNINDLTIVNSQAVGEAVRRVCRDIPTEICELESQEEEAGCGEDQERPRRVCETRLIPVTRTVQREECGNTNDVSYTTDIFPYARDFYETKFL